MTNKPEEVPVIVRFSLRLPVDLDQDVRNEAIQDSRDRNNMIQVLLKEALKHRRNSATPGSAAESAPDNPPHD